MPDTSGSRGARDAVTEAGVTATRESADHPEQFISHEDMQRLFAGGPQLGSAAVLALHRGRIYRREGGGWRRLGNRSHSTVKEMIDESA